MGLRIGTNIAAITAARNLARNSEQMSRSYQALASGNRIARPGDDAAGFAISERLRGQEKGLAQARMNSDSAVGMIQVAEGGLSEQTNIIVRLKEIAVQAASDTVGTDERGFLDTEYQSLSKELDRIAASTRYGQMQLLNGGNTTYSFFVGSSGDRSTDVIEYKMDADTRLNSLGLDGLSVTSKNNAEDALSTLDDGLKKLSQARANFGAIQERLQIAGSNLDIQRENVAEARSRITDADVAEEVTNLTRARVLQDFGTSVLAQANQEPIRALKLL